MCLSGRSNHPLVKHWLRAKSTSHIAYSRNDCSLSPVSRIVEISCLDYCHDIVAVAWRSTAALGGRRCCTVVRIHSLVPIGSCEVPSVCRRYLSEYGLHVQQSLIPY